MLKYTGKGEMWVAGGVMVPRRDLTDEEVERYGGEAALLESGLYEKPARKKPAEVKNGDEFED